MKKKLSIFLVVILSTLLSAQSSSIKFQKGMAAYHSADYTKAISVFENLLSDEKNDKEVISTSEYYIAESLMGLNKIDGAAGKFSDFINKYPMSNFRDLALYRLGTIFYNKQNYSSCRERLLQLLNEYPQSQYAGSAYYWVGQSYAEENNYSDAEQFLKEAISSTNNNYVAHTIYALANLYEKIKDYTNAVTYYDELLAYHSKSELAPFSQMRIGICSFKLKEYDRAVLELSDPLINELTSKLQIESKIVLANSFYRLKDYKNASQTYQLILASYPDSVDTKEIRYGLAWVNFQMQEYEDAFKIFSEIAESGRDSLAINSLFWSAESKRYLGENDTALNIYKKFLENYPGSSLAAKAKFNSGIIYFGKTNINESEKNLLNSLESGDNITKAKAFTLLGEISLNKKEIGRASCRERV